MLDPQILQCLSEEPGVYLIYDSSSTVIYVGKAKSLKKRVAQYLREGGDGRVLMPYLQRDATRVETMIVSSEAEALLLENNLIKHHQPKYNILLKDDKGYLALKLASNETWPRLEMVRYRSKTRSDELMGPYTAIVAKQMVQFVNESFMLRRCSDHELKNRTRPCLLYDMKRCLAPCVKPEEVKELYKEQTQEVKEFLKGRSKRMLNQLEEKIERASERLEFEKAGELYETKKRLLQVLAQQSVELMDGRSSELLHLEREGAEGKYSRICLGRVSVREGQLLDLSCEIFDSVEGDELELLQSLALQHMTSMGEHWNQLETLWVNLGPHELKVLQMSLAELGCSVVCRAPLRGKPRQWVELARRNCLHRLSKAEMEKTQRYGQLADLQLRLSLENLPVWMECVDTSHHAGKDHVASIAVFVEAQPARALSRRYRVKGLGGDDYEAMRQVIKRRLERAHKEGKWPDLLVIDGGLVHLKIASDLLREFDWVATELIAISKEMGKHSKGLNREWIHRPDRPSLQLDPADRSLHLIQRLRDEAHRLAIEYHRLRQSKALTRSALDDIPGIGPKKRAALLRHFGSVAALKRGTLDQLDQLSVLSALDRKRLMEFLGLGQS